MLHGRWLVAGLLVCLLGMPGCSNPDAKLTVIRIPIRTSDPKSLDPVRCSTTYENQILSQVYEPLLQYKYFVRPYALEPLLLSELPTVSADGMTYRFRLRPDIRFHDDPCFAAGKGRRVTTTDVFYSWKRMADNDNNPKSWWLLEDTIAGFDDYRRRQNAAATFDYDAPVEGLRAINEREFEVTLNKPVQRFLHVMAMFQTAVVPREAIEKYGEDFAKHPVGTGPYRMKSDGWRKGQRITLYRNPTYREELFPTERMPDDSPPDFITGQGKRLPILDKVVFNFYSQEDPMWLDFKSRKLDYVQVPNKFFEEAYVKRTRALRPEYRQKGYRSASVPLIDFIHFGFNMNDPLIGGYDPETRTYSEQAKYLRQAIALAIDWDERNDAFYSGINVIYDGPIPPQLDGHPQGGVAPHSYRGLDLDRAAELFARAGYPKGEGLPPITYYGSSESNMAEQAELLKRQLGRAGIVLDVRLVKFAELNDLTHNGKAPFFSMAWSSDYPDAENNLALFYGPNKAPGSNYFNYQNSQYDDWFRQIEVLPPSPERTRILEQMRDLLIEETPFIGSMARTRHYLMSPQVRNFKPTETFMNWVKYLDVDRSVAW